MARNVRNQSVKPHNALISQLAGANNLPCLPHITAKLLDLFASPGTSVEEVADILRFDPALSLHVMRLAHVGADVSAKSIPNLTEAVHRVGVDAVANMVRWNSALDVFDAFSFCSPRDLTRFWVHSTRCALLSEEVARKLEYPDPEEAYLAGLLHDVGKLVLLTYFPNKYKLLFSEIGKPEDRIAEEESQVNHNHAAAGASLVRRWPHHSMLADAVGYHHHPVHEVEQAFPLVKIVYASNVMASLDIQKSGLDRPEIVILGLGFAQLDQVYGTACEKFESVRSECGIDITDANADVDHTPASFANAYTSVSGHVRDTSLLAALAYNLLNAKTISEVLRMVEHTLRVHFDIDRVVLLLENPDHQVLEAKGRYCEVAGDLAIPLASEACLPVLALSQNKPLESFTASDENRAPIMDAQIVHYLQKEGMLCIPMVVDNDSMGCITIGLDRADLTTLSGQQDLLARFASYIGGSLRKLRSARTPTQPEPAVAGAASNGDLNALRTLARRTVHEINNPLGIINNYLSVLGRRLAEERVAHDEIRIISEEIARIRNILATLADSSKDDSVSLRPVDLNTLLRDLVRLMQADLSERSNIQIHAELSPAMPMALTDKDMLKQALINLLKNSAEALTEGGNIHVQTVYAPKDAGGFSNSDGRVASQNGRAHLVIRDDGPGIPQPVREKLFQPFVTSKDGHEGLGLSIVRRLIDQLSGTIECDSANGAGTQFTIGLPIVSPK